MQTYEKIQKVPINEIRDKYGTLRLNDYRVLVWTANYETAVFNINHAIHEEAAYVWIELNDNKNRPIIVKYKRNGNEWEYVEDTIGSIWHVNYNPFAPKDNAASNSAESVFEVNKRKKSWLLLWDGLEVYERLGLGNYVNNNSI